MPHKRLNTEHQLHSEPLKDDSQALRPEFSFYTRDKAEGTVAQTRGESSLRAMPWPGGEKIPQPALE